MLAKYKHIGKDQGRSGANKIRKGSHKKLQNFRRCLKLQCSRTEDRACYPTGEPVMHWGTCYVTKRHLEVV